MARERTQGPDNCGYAGWLFPALRDPATMKPLTDQITGEPVIDPNTGKQMLNDRTGKIVRKGFFYLRMERGLEETHHLRGMTYPCEQCVNEQGVIMDNISLDYWCLTCLTTRIRARTPILDYTPLHRGHERYTDMLRGAHFIRE